MAASIAPLCPLAQNITKGMSSMKRIGFHRVLRCLHKQNNTLFSQSAAHANQQALKVSDDGPNTLVIDKSSDVRFQEALEHEDYFQLKDLVTLKDLFQARVHLGHNSGLRHTTMSPFVFGERLGRDIIDLDQTLPRLLEALNVCAHIVYRGGMVLFLCRNMQILPWVERMAKDVNEYSHCRTWKRGIFTNASHTFNTLPIYPELCVFFNTQDTVFEQHRAVVESSKLLIPSIGFVDTNCNAEHISYVIPANDDTPSSLHLYIHLFRSIVLRAKQKRKEDGLEVVPPSKE